MIHTSQDDPLPASEADVQSAAHEPSRANLSALGDALKTVQVRSVALTLLLVLAVLYTLYFARAFLLPLVLAFLLELLLSPVVRWLGHRGVPTAAGAGLVLLALLGGVGFAGYELAAPAQEWFDKAPQAVATINARLHELKRPVEQVSKAAEQIEDAATVGGADRESQVTVKGPSLISRFFGTTQALVVAVFEVLVLLYFLLAVGDMFLEKLIKVLPQLRDKKTAVRIAREVESSVSVYLSTVTLVNIAEGLVLALALWAIGMPAPFFWGAVAALVEFVPYIGAVFMLGVLTLVALSTFDSVGHALLVPAAFLVINLIQGNLVSPLLHSRRLTLNPVAIVVGLAFWWWIWGVPGAFVAVPLLATLKIFCDHIEALKPIGEFLGQLMRDWLAAGAALGATLPGLALRLGWFGASDPLTALVYGTAIVGAAFLLSWAAEVFQLDVSQGLALALLALIAILPEYVVDATFAWLAAEEPSYASYAVANMTGANRLLIGIAWPLVVVLVWLRTRRVTVELEPSHGVELVALLAATLYAFLLPIKGSISLVDLGVLAGIFALYLWRLTKAEAETPHLVGPAARIGRLSPGRRRTVTAALAIVAAVVILFQAKPFAKALVATGAALGVDEFLLVQWLAPLASEAPEFVVVGIFAWRAAGAAALGTLVSSKVNQWTLLVGMLPLVYSLALGRPAALLLDERQREEILLTAAQSLFAVVLLLDLRLSLKGAAVLFGLFTLQLAIPGIRMEVSLVYFLLSAVALVVSRRRLGSVFRGLRVPPGAA